MENLITINGKKVLETKHNYTGYKTVFTKLNGDHFATIPLEHKTTI